MTSVLSATSTLPQASSTSSSTSTGSNSTSTGSTSTGSTSTGSSSSTTTTPTVNYTECLQLLVQELKNQDPSNPSDPTQFVSQIATFSNVEQAVQSNATLTSLLTTTALSQAENAIGKTVTSADGQTTGVVQSVALSSGGVATATLTSGATLTLDSTVTISNTTGS